MSYLCNKGSVLRILSSMIIGLFILTACGSKTEPETLKIGVMSDVGAVPFLIAKEQGFFEEEGLDVELSVFKSAVDRDSALQTGNLEGAMADVLSVIFFNNAGIDMRIVTTANSDYKMVSSPALDNKSFMELDSISVGLSSHTVIDFASQKIAEENGFEDKLDKVAIPQMPVRLEMLRAGELSSATLPEPLASAALLDGGEVIGSTTEFNLYPGVFLASSDSLKDRKETWMKFFTAYNKAVDLINKDPQSISFDLLVEKLGFPPVLKDSFSLPNFDKARQPDTYTFETIMSWMELNELSQVTYSSEELIDGSVLPKK